MPLLILNACLWSFDNLLVICLGLCNRGFGTECFLEKSDWGWYIGSILSSTFTFTISKSFVVLFLYLFIGPATLFDCGTAISDFPGSDDTQKSHRSRHRMHKSSVSSHRTMSRSLSCDSQSKGSVSTPRGSMVCNPVLFFCLPFPILLS